ncbi:MAG: hypothetical protein Tsb0034_10700 [Ekhidna sp.]
MYLTLVVSFLLLIGSLPFLTINVSTNASGIIDTKTNRFDILTPVAGHVVANRLVENGQVRKGDVILQLDNSFIEHELDQIQQRLIEIEIYIKDLKALIAEDRNAIVNSTRYRIEQLQFDTKLQQLYHEEATLRKIYERQKALYLQKVIAQAEYDKDKANYERAVSEIELFKKQSIANWEEAFLAFIEDRKSLKLREKQLLQEQNKYNLYAPASGELQNVMAVSIGQHLPAGQKIAQLTPDTTLMAVCWVPPEKVGLLKIGMTGSFRIDAYNYNDWGFIHGSIIKISSDAYLVNNQPLFKVICSLSKAHLTLKNGFVGTLKKGMTLQANFIVTRRTLFQLLYDKVDNWLNPNIK